MNNQTKPIKKIYISDFGLLHALAFVSAFFSFPFVIIILSYLTHHPLEELWPWDFNSDIFFSVSFLFWDFFFFSIFSPSGVATIGGEGLKERTDGRTGVGGIDAFPGTPGYLSRS